MKRNFSQVLKTERGSGLVIALLATAALIAATTLVFKSGGLQRGANLDTKQRQIVAKAIADMNSILADLSECTSAMKLGTPFSTVGSYSAGTNLGSNVTIESMSSVLSNRIYTISVIFKKINHITKGTTTQRALITAKKLLSTAIPPTDCCISFETTGAEDSFKLFCRSTGGTFIESSGTCDHSGFIDGAFRTRLVSYACTLIGGVFSGTRCDKINIAGSIHSSTYLPKTHSIKLSPDSRTAFSGSTCPNGQVAIGFLPNGSLNCSTLNCNAYTAAKNGVYSNYTASSTSENIMCMCTRDFKFGQSVNGNKAPASPKGTTGMGCSQPDQNSCIDYYYDDGCGTGTKCFILRGKYPGCTKTTTDKKEILVNSCGDVCAVGPGCTASGHCATSPPLPPSTVTCTPGTYSDCILPVAGQNTNRVNGQCSVMPSITCTANCSSTGSWTSINTSNCLVPINGECSTVTQEICTKGKYVDVTDTATHELWKCSGENGGSTTSCSIAKPINGVCATDVNSCSAGSIQDIADTSTLYKWNCRGLNGGATASCSNKKGGCWDGTTPYTSKYACESEWGNCETITNYTGDWKWSVESSYYEYYSTCDHKTYVTNCPGSYPQHPSTSCSAANENQMKYCYDCVVEDYVDFDTNDLVRIHNTCLPIKTYKYCPLEE